MDQPISNVDLGLDDANPDTIKGECHPLNEHLISTITLGDPFDMTIVVGSDDKHSGQKRFHILSHVLRLASPVWKAMTNGSWLETSSNEISFPDDDADAFLLVLYIAHFQSQKLPDKLTKTQLVELAILCDKYDLVKIVMPYVQSRNWIASHRAEGWKGDKCDWLFATKTFGLKSDHQELLHNLVLHIHTNGNGDYLNGPTGKVIDFRDGLPAGLLDDAMNLRETIIDALLKKSYEVLDQTMVKCTCHLGIRDCHAMMMGNLIQGYLSRGLLPNRRDASTVTESVFTFAESLKKVRIGVYPKPHGSTSHEACLRNLTLKVAVSEILEQFIPCAKAKKAARNA